MAIIYSKAVELLLINKKKALASVSSTQYRAAMDKRPL